jgi:hypothetical protein
MYARSLGTGEDTLILMKLRIALSRGIVLEEAVDLSSDRLLLRTVRACAVTQTSRDAHC